VPDTHRIVESPIGPLLIGAGDGELTLLYTSRFPEHRPGGGDADDEAVLDETERQLGRYFEGTLTEFDLPIGPRGTPFQQRVWAALCDIPYGETISYGELARRVGRPGSARAVGAANGSNPISIIVPCHRVIGANGKLTGYGGGLPRKAWLIDHEAGHGPGQLALAPAALSAVR
jgi:methylated-DNA-[protein]-cysteine S-methyltransferase